MRSDQAKGTSVSLIEKFPDARAHSLARRLIAEAWRDNPKEFRDEPGLVWQMPKRLGLVRDGRPGYAIGSWNGLDVVRKHIETVFEVIEAGEGVMRAVPIQRSPDRVRRHAETFREWIVAGALARLTDELVVVEGNIFLNEGINEAWLLITGGGGTAYNNANARLGVGDSTTAAAATQTDLQAATNKTFVAMDGGFPTAGTSQQAAFKSTFGDGVAPYPWDEWSLRRGAAEAAALNLNRKVEALGTKGATGTWTLTATLSIA